jgi:hypothetical protein
MRQVLLIQAAMEVWRRPGVWTTVHNVILVALLYCGHRGQRLILQVWSGCQTTINCECTAPKGSSHSNRLGKSKDIISHYD